MDDWAKTVSGWAGQALNAVIDKKVNNPHQMELAKLQMYGGYGYFPGMEGEGGPGMPVMGQYGSPVSPILLIGGAVVLFMLLKD